LVKAEGGGGPLGSGGIGGDQRHSARYDGRIGTYKRLRVARYGDDEWVANYRDADRAIRIGPPRCA